MQKNTLQRPFLKWAGGKTQLVHKITVLLPKGNKLIEPFVGAGSVFLNTKYSKYLLCDINADLIALYQLLKVDGDRVIQETKKLFTQKNNQKEKYYELRNQFNCSDDIFERSILFVYLNRHAYNGLCRYNRHGQFNVPFGRYNKPYFPEKELYFFQEKAACATFLCADYSTAMNRARQGNVVYCDPPYSPLSDTAYFTQYSSNTFAEKEQRELAQKAIQLSSKGIPTLMSNHKTPLTMALYEQAYIQEIEVKRRISCKASSRKPVTELLALF